jgi:hypothetical protein
MYIYIFIYRYIYTCTYTCTHTYTYKHTCTCTSTSYTLSAQSACMHIHVYINTYDSAYNWSALSKILEQPHTYYVTSSYILCHIIIHVYGRRKAQLERAIKDSRAAANAGTSLFRQVCMMM